MVIEMEVITDESKGNNIADVLLISPARAKILRRVVHNAAVGAETYTESMSIIAGLCENTNELSYALWAFGILVAENRNRHKTDAEDTLNTLKQVVALLEKVKKPGSSSSEEEEFAGALKEFMEEDE